MTYMTLLLSHFNSGSTLNLGLPLSKKNVCNYFM